VRTRLAVTLAVIVAACAGSASAAPISTADQATAIADAINLTNADMVGYDDTPADQADTVVEPFGTGCAHAAPVSHLIGGAASDAFASADARGLELVFSSVGVWSSADDAASNSAGFFGARGRACLKKELVKALRTETDKHTRLVSVTVTKLASGLAGVRGLRAKFVLASGKERIATFVDGFDFTRGQAEVTLSVVGIPKAFAKGKARRLLKLLMQRAAVQVPDLNLAPGAPPQPLG
jgi:hypothetical protein